MGVSGGGGGVGADVPGNAGRALAAAAHLNLAGPLVLALFPLAGGDTDTASGVGFFLALMWTMADAVAWILSRRMASPAASHASQAFWWAVAAFVVFVLLIVFSGPALGFVALAAFAVMGALGAWRVVRGEGHRYPGIAVLMEGRR